jgi:predicted DNA-binding transcriptional regulator AlpA
MSSSDKRRRKRGKPRRELQELQERAATARAAKKSELLPFVAKPLPDGEPRRFIYKAQVLERTGLSFPTIWGWMRRGLFPQAVDLNGQSAWFEHELNQWFDERPRRQYLPQAAE